MITKKLLLIPQQTGDLEHSCALHHVLMLYYVFQYLSFKP